MQRTKVAVVGASGYGGAELIRILSRHPGVQLVGLSSRRYAGHNISEIWPQQSAKFVLTTPEEAVQEAELVFAATPSGYAMKAASEWLAGGRRVVDLSADFRLPAALYPEWYGFTHTHPELLKQAVYGLTELHRNELDTADLVANPGCYATAASLGLAPIAAEGLLGDGLVLNAVSGASGAGREAPGLGFAETNENYKPYKVAGEHRHTPEIELNLGRVAAQGREVSTRGAVQKLCVVFTPHVAPMTRGILVSSSFWPKREITEQELIELLDTFYHGEAFIRISKELPQTKGTFGSNLVWISVRVDRRTGAVLVFSALDNLVKGAAGQAVQNMNRMLGFEEALGLAVAGIWP